MPITPTKISAANIPRYYMIAEVIHGAPDMRPRDDLFFPVPLFLVRNLIITVLITTTLLTVPSPRTICLPQLPPPILFATSTSFTTFPLKQPLPSPYTTSRRRKF